MRVYIAVYGSVGGAWTWVDHNHRILIPRYRTCPNVRNGRREKDASHNETDSPGGAAPRTAGGVWCVRFPGVLVMQVESDDVTQWTKVEYDNAGVVSDFPAAGIVVRVFASIVHDHSRVSGLTVDACIPRPRNHLPSLSLSLIGPQVASLHISLNSTGPFTL